MKKKTAKKENENISLKLKNKAKEINDLYEVYSEIVPCEYPESEYRILEKKYSKLQYEFVKYCIKHRLSYEEVGRLINLTKQRVYQIYRYGLKGLMPRNKRNFIIERDGNRCLVCMIEGSKKSPLHVHHLMTPKNHNKNNLVSLCSSCHAKLDQLNKKDEEFKQFYAKKLSTKVALRK